MMPHCRRNTAVSACSGYISAILSNIFNIKWTANLLCPRLFLCHLWFWARRKKFGQTIDPRQHHADPRRLALMNQQSKCQCQIHYYISLSTSIRWSCSDLESMSWDRMWPCFPPEAKQFAIGTAHSECLILKVWRNLDELEHYTTLEQLWTNHLAQLTS